MSLGCALGEIIELVLRLATRGEDRKTQEERKEGADDGKKGK